MTRGGHGKPAYRCRNGHTRVAGPDPSRPGNAYVRGDLLLRYLPAVCLLATGAEPVIPRPRRTRRGADARPQISAVDVIGYLRGHGITLTWDQAAGTLTAGTAGAAKTITMKAS